MAVSPDDRFAGLLNSSAERGGWVPGDVFTADTAGEEETVAPRRVRLPVLVAVAIATVGVLALAFFLFRPVPQHSPTASPGQADPSQQGAGDSDGSVGAASPDAAGEGQSGPASASPSGEVIVHVTGAVSSPSVVTLPAGARVQDAVEAAGGLRGDAAAESVNLARVLADGEQIHIPEEGEEPEDRAAGAGGQPAGGPEGDAATNAGADSGGGSAGHAAAADGAAQGAPGQTGRVDLNTADATALQTLPGVGPVTAEAIISHRQTQPFAAVEDLLLVKGIGPKTYESLKDLVTVG
ncbi:ComEA family DNA-binding protein [Brevibacterium renqingii]|uniref:ComEA family DNA-binding protein n=1 Tax=Brevibacterium renqingii TaxID=2776916 RepID=UPI001AE0C344|nr:ComEA family DNA-binding protein [Brevibacterium renqingii]